jgi:hypothetical protein
LQPSGYAEFSNIVIRGAIYTGTIYAGSGQIGGININLHDIRSAGYVSGTSGFRINDDGSAEFYNITARGNITATSLNAATGTFSGSLSAATGTYSGVLTAAAINAVNTINLAGNAVTVPIAGSNSGVARTVTSTTSKSTSTTIGAITTDANGAGRVLLQISPAGISSQAQWWIYSYVLAECSVTDSADTLTVVFSIKRTVGATVTTIWTQSTVNGVSSGSTSTRFCHSPIISDVPGAGVTATYTLHIDSSNSSTPTNHAHEIIQFNYVLTESKR